LSVFVTVLDDVLFEIWASLKKAMKVTTIKMTAKIALRMAPGYEETSSVFCAVEFGGYLLQGCVA